MILVCLAGQRAHAADSVRIIRSIPIEARMIAMDELGNTYAVRNDNVLIRYDKQGDSTGFYRGVLNGDITAVDVTNPLRILLYYAAYTKVVLLDRMLSELSVIDLRRQQILTSTAVATSSDGKLWVYDPFNARLIKMDEAGEIIRTSNDLRQQIDFVPTPVFMLERDRRVYVSDLSRGVIVFDQFANYISTLPLMPVERLQAFDQQLVYRIGNVLHSYDMKSFSAREFPLPKAADHILDATLGPNTLSVLYQHKLVIYPWPL
jgi:hypothetical protein